MIVPTLGRPTLPRLLDSIGETPHEILVIGDEASGDLSHVKAEVEGRGYVYLGIDLGHPARAGQLLRDEGIKRATGEYLVFNDDSDIFTPEALEVVARRASELEQPAPMLFRAIMPGGQTLWHQAPSVNEGEVDGHQFVAPNIPAKLGEWGTYVHGDYWFIKSTLEKWAGHYVPQSDVIAECFSPL